MSRLGVTVLGAILFLGLAGCGGAGGGGPVGFESGTDEAAIDDLIGKFADYTNNLKNFRSLYSKDSQPTKADMAKCKDAFFYASTSNPPVVTGDTAVIPLTSEDTDGNESSVEWTAVKEDGEWKLDKTPL